MHKKISAYYYLKTKAYFYHLMFLFQKMLHILYAEMQQFIKNLYKMLENNKLYMQKDDFLNEKVINDS